MIIGIATSVKDDISINMDFYDDSIDKVMKNVCLKIGNIYNIIYEKNNTIFECKCKIIDIIYPNIEDYDLNIGFVKQYVGMNDSIYCTRDHFMKLPSAKNIVIVVDTSDNFEGRYENIKLNSIRDCELYCNNYNMKFEYDGKKISIYEDGKVTISDSDGIMLESTVIDMVNNSLI